MEAEKIHKEIARASDELLDRIRDSYKSGKGWNTARKYIHGLMSGAERSGKTGGSCQNSWVNIRPICYSSFYIVAVGMQTERETSCEVMYVSIWARRMACL